ncbi:hypothetical protein ACN38_g7591 [Penicillium nordicum]|uniref:Uncharacterized protein n=1 Tax=Penicillium nordicum TaxID=229535 RepID=A0A0M8P1D3_9EURO|nr:hypothetical protein ACN38_g7591 [Penicillium nordicum]
MHAGLLQTESLACYLLFVSLFATTEHCLDGSSRVYNPCISSLINKSNSSSAFSHTVKETHEKRHRFDAQSWGGGCVEQSPMQACMFAITEQCLDGFRRVYNPLHF